jgi:hypothetical protein
LASNQTEYFAAKPSDDLAHEIEEKAGDWSNFRAKSGLQRRWLKSYRFYYGMHFKGDALTSSPGLIRMGEQGELAGLKVNHFRNFLKHLLVMATNQKINFDVRAINSDLKSLQQARLGSNILDAYVHEKRLGRYLKLAAEQALVFGKSFVQINWDKALGRPYGAEYVKDESAEDGLARDEQGQPIERVVYEGDIELSTLSPFDVFVDSGADDFNKCDWVIVRKFKNKFNLAARYPMKRDEILNLQTKSELQGIQYLTIQSCDESNDVPVYEFYHRRTPALPNGRVMICAGQDVVLYDGPIPYDRLPVFRITAGEIMGTTEGYTDAFDLLALQEAMNVLASSIFSNQNAFAVQSILVPEGANLSASQLGKGLKVFKYNPQAGEPKPLQLTATPAEVFNFYNLLERTMETISGVNAVARGNPEHSLKSGVALGLVQSMAVQYASGFQQSWAELLEDCGTFILKLIKDFAKTERMIAMAGKQNRGHMVHFTGKDLENVDRCIVELGNPMSRTTAGRVQIADNLLEKGLIKTPQQYLNVMNTGQLESMTEGAESQLALVRQENEWMMEGKPVQAIVGDAHLLHMQEHLAMLSNPEVRMNAQIVELVLSHIDEHKNLKQNQDPIFDAISGEPPAPQPQMPPGPPPGPQGAPPMMPPMPEGANPPLPNVEVPMPAPLDQMGAGF